MAEQCTIKRKRRSRAEIVDSYGGNPIPQLQSAAIAAQRLKAHMSAKVPRLNPVLASVLLALGGCAATTRTQLTPSPQLPVCQASSTAIVVWAPQWRMDQKDVPAREAAASDGISRFFKDSGCFASVSVRRVAQLSASDIGSAASEGALGYDRLVTIAVRELGPIVKLGSSLALVEGGTEVILDIGEYKLPNPVPRAFSVRWLNGGPGVIKGVATLPQDIQAALSAGLQPGPR